MPYMVAFTINISQMLAHIYIYTIHGSYGCLKMIEPLHPHFLRMGLGKSLQALALLWAVLSNNLLAKATTRAVFFQSSPGLVKRKERKEGHKEHKGHKENQNHET